ncbi:MAG: LTA synthase family protein [Bacteroidia bacterium]|nr:LTA synthase family protein [Bacteroidia bacterium]
MLIKRFVVALAVLFTARLFFYIYNLNSFKISNLSEFVNVFFWGSYFDLISVFYLLLPFILLSLLPFNFTINAFYQKILKVFFIVITFSILILTIIDAVYYPFSKTRIGFEVFKMAASEEISIIQYVFSYWYILPFAALLAYFIFRIYPENKNKNLIKWHVELPINLIFILVLAFTIRGGLRLKPLRSIDASLFVKPQHTQLTISTGFNIIESFQAESIANVNYINQIQFSKVQNKDYIAINSNIIKPKNIFIIILESFGKEYCFPNISNTVYYTPFLSELALRSEFYSKAYSNGTRSVDAIPAILEGVPKLTKSDFMYSNYIKNITPGFAFYLNKIGYSCNFYHGGINGTLGFEAFLKSRGWNYYGKNQYIGKKEDYDGNWGIYDGPYLNYVKNEVNKYQKPFVTVVFTLSSHHPYKLPVEYIDSFKKINKPIHRTVKYVDNCLRNFFKSIKNEEWYNNTLFIITADHSAENFTKQYNTINGKYEVPLLVYEPLKNKSDTINKIIQHIDILPLALSKSGYNGRIFTIGTFLKKDAVKMSFHNEDGIYTAFTDSLCITFDGKKSKFFNLYNKQKPKAEKSKILEYEFKCIIQDFNNRIISNKFY